MCGWRIKSEYTSYYYFVALKILVNFWRGCFQWALRLTRLDWQVAGFDGSGEPRFYVCAVKSGIGGELTEYLDCYYWLVV
jgi:hypothetical protein